MSRTPRLGSGVITTPVQTAFKIMGNNAFGPEAVSACLGHNFTDRQLSILGMGVPFSPATLQVRADTHVLVPVPALNFAGIYRRLGDKFASWPDTTAWFLTHRFVAKRPSLSWQLVRKFYDPSVCNLPWHDQILRMSLYEAVPSAALLALVALVVHATTHRRLYESNFVWTADQDNRGHRVAIGGFGEQGLGVVSVNATCQYVWPGLATCVVPPGPIS